jgi:hypothetical protein
MIILAPPRGSLIPAEVPPIDAEILSKESRPLLSPPLIVSLGKSLILNNSWLTKYDSVVLGQLAVSGAPISVSETGGLLAAEAKKL